jgi:hypothetical protein
MTVTELQTQVTKLTKEPQSTPVFATTANIILFGNEAQEHIMRRLKNRIKTNAPSTPWSANQYQTISFSTIPIGGTYTLSFRSQTTSTLAATAAAATVQAALELLSTIGAGNVTVTGSNIDGFVVTFGKVFSGTIITAITLTPTTLVDVIGTTSTATITGVTAGDKDPSFFTKSGQRLYTLPSDFLEMVKLSVRGIPVTPGRFDEVASAAIWNRIPGFPARYLFEKDSIDGIYKLQLWPIPTGSWSITMVYVPRPILTTSASSSFDIEDALGHLLVSFVNQKIMEMRREYEKAKYWEIQYEQDVAEYLQSGQDTNETMEFLDGPVPTD